MRQQTVSAEVLINSSEGRIRFRCPASSTNSGRRIDDNSAVGEDLTSVDKGL